MRLSRTDRLVGRVVHAELGARRPNLPAGAGLAAGAVSLGEAGFAPRRDRSDQRGEHAGSGLLVGAAERLERRREVRDGVAVTGRERRGALDHGGRDRVGTCGVPGSPGTRLGVLMSVEYGCLRPDGCVPRPVDDLARVPPGCGIVQIHSETVRRYAELAVV